MMWKSKFYSFATDLMLYLSTLQIKLNN